MKLSHRILNGSILLFALFHCHTITSIPAEALQNNPGIAQQPKSCYNALYALGLELAERIIKERKLSTETVVVYIKSLGVPANFKNNKGVPLLILATLRRSTTLVRDLLRAGASTNIQDPSGQTALHHAARLNACDILKLLLNSTEIEVNRIDTQKRTALMIAAMMGHRAVTQLLLAQRAKKELKDTSGKTAHDYAHNHEHSKLATKLKPNRGKADHTTSVFANTQFTETECSEHDVKNQASNALQENQAELPVFH